jgi:hypothetical protein
MISSAARKVPSQAGFVPRKIPIRTVILVTILGFLGLFIVTPGVSASNMLLNGDLRAGSAEMPANWDISPGAPAGSYGWSHDRGGQPALEIGTSGLHRNNYWSQTISTGEAGWYRLRVDIKTEGTGTEAVIEVSSQHGKALASAGYAQWSPFDAYFKVVSPNQTLVIEFGARGQSGRAFFRDISLNRIFGAPPKAARVVDIGTALDTVAAPQLQPMPQEDLRGPRAFGAAVRRLLHLARVPASENAALLDAKIAKAPDDDSLVSDIVNVRVAGAILLVLSAITFLDWRYSPGLPSVELTKSAGVAAFLCLTLLGTWLVTRLEYIPGLGFYVVEPHAVGGDEPHYLVMINGLMLRRDLELQTVYDDVDSGGPEAGVMARHTKLDRHTIVTNRRTGHRATGVVEGGVNGGLWHRDPRPEFAPSPDVYETSVHPSGFPLLIASLLALMRPRAGKVESDAGFILMLIAWLGVVATYFVARQVGMGRGWSILAAAILFAASPWLAYSRAYFAESSIGTAMVLGLWALMADLPIVATLAAGAAAAMKPPFALASAGFLIDKVREKRWKDAIKIAAVMALGIPVLLMLARTFSLHRRFFPLSQFVNTFVDSHEGLLLYAPWTIFGFFACARSLPQMSEDARLPRTMALPLFLYLLTVSSVGYGAGYCYGPRFWIAFMPWLALATIAAMRQMGPYLRAVCVLALLCGVAMAIPGALRYPQLFGRPALDAWRGFH